MYLSDMHTHTIASGHGTKSTISDMAKAASKKGLVLLGITDHAPATPGAGTESYFRSLPYSPRKRFGVQLFYGAELNILDPEGTVDLSEEILSGLDYAIASMHAPNFKSHTEEENTAAFLNVMKNPHVKILGHCDNPVYPVNYDVLVRSAKEHRVLLEINEASLAPYGYRGDTAANSREILRCSLKYQHPILLSSDSHGTQHIGDFSYSAEFVHQEGFPGSLILNNQLSKLKAFLQDRQHP